MTQYGASLLSATATLDSVSHPAILHHYYPVPSAPVPTSSLQELLTRIQRGELLVINSRRKNGLILGKRFHAEFAGPGAAIGGALDLDCEWLLPIGNLSWVLPESGEEEKAFLIRRQWVKLITRLFTEGSTPLERASNVLDHFEGYFDLETIQQLPSEAWALLIGVFPQTIDAARQGLRSAS
jgi:hypothetical protein